MRIKYAELHMLLRLLFSFISSLQKLFRFGACNVLRKWVRLLLKKVSDWLLEFLISYQSFDWLCRLFNVALTATTTTAQRSSKWGWKYKSSHFVARSASFSSHFAASHFAAAILQLRPSHCLKISKVPSGTRKAGDSWHKRNLSQYYHTDMKTYLQSVGEVLAAKFAF